MERTYSSNFFNKMKYMSNNSYNTTAPMNSTYRRDVNYNHSNKTENQQSINNSSNKIRKVNSSMTKQIVKSKPKFGVNPNALNDKNLSYNPKNSIREFKKKARESINLSENVDEQKASISKPLFNYQNFEVNPENFIEPKD